MTFTDDHGARQTETATIRSDDPSRRRVPRPCRRSLRRSPRRSTRGYDDARPETRAMQDDDTATPASCGCSRAPPVVGAHGQRREKLRRLP